MHLYLSVYGYNGREKRTDTFQSTHLQWYSISNTKFVRGMKDFFLKMFSVLFREVCNVDGRRLSLARAKNWNNKGHINEHSKDTFSNIILGQKIVVKYEEVH